MKTDQQQRKSKKAWKAPRLKELDSKATATGGRPGDENLNGRGIPAGQQS